MGERDVWMWGLGEGVGLSTVWELFVSSRCCPKLAVVISGLVVAALAATFPAYRWVQVQMLAGLVVDTLRLVG